MEERRLMRVGYDRKADVLYLSIGSPRPAVARELGDDVLLRLDAVTGEVVGLTILNLSTRSSLDDLPLEIDLHIPA